MAPIRTEKRKSPRWMLNAWTSSNKEHIHFPFLSFFHCCGLLRHLYWKKYDNKNGQTEAKSRGSDQDMGNSLFCLRSCQKAENEASSLRGQAE